MGHRRLSPEDVADLDRVFGVEPRRDTSTPSPPVILPEAVNRFVPSSGFLRTYVEYAYPLTEAPVESHIAAGLVMLSALAGRRVTLPWADDLLYLNVWATLVGPSTLSRKSTTLRKSEHIIRAAEADRIVADTPSRILPDDATGAALSDLLEQNPERVWFLSELALLFAQFGAKHNIGYKQHLANLFDVPPMWEIARRGDRDHSRVARVERPYLAILGATTTAWLKEHFSEGDLLGGLYARFLYFLLPDPGVNGRRISIPPPADVARRTQLVDQAKRLYFLSGTVQLDPDSIRDRYAAWYGDHRREVYQLHKPERLGPFWGRLETYCLKLAGLYQLSAFASIGEVPVSAEPITISIERDALDYAIALVEHLKVGLAAFVDQELGTSRIEAAQQKMLKIVGTAGGRIAQRDLQRKMSLLPDDFQKVLRGLCEDGRLTKALEQTQSNQTRIWVSVGSDADG